MASRRTTAAGRTASGRRPTRPRGDETRARILRAALAGFRRKGLDRTTMRDIAEGAGVALGAAYYYFPSKDALVLAYYDHTQRECSERAGAAFAETGDVRARLGAVFHGKLDVLARDRRLLLAIFRSVADRDAEASLFGAASAEVREESIRLLDEAIGTSEAIATLDRAARRVVALAFWSLQMGVLLYFIHDTSPRQAKTRRLVDRALDLTCRLLPLAGELAPMLGAEIASMLAEASLLGENEGGAVLAPAARNGKAPSTRGEAP